MPMHRRMLVVLLVVVWSLSVPIVGSGQDTSLIYACVDPQGRLTIIAPGGSCGARETLLTWPAAPTAPTMFYQRASQPQPVVEGTVAIAVAFCDDPADTAVGGGFRTDRLASNAYIYHVITSTSCEASGLCSGPSGQDGWVVMVKGNMVPAEGVTVTAYVICTRP
jgi:hypothetical protein